MCYPWVFQDGKSIDNVHRHCHCYQKNDQKMKFVQFHGRSHKIVKINFSCHSAKQAGVGKPNLHSVTYYTGSLDKDGNVANPNGAIIDTGWAHTSQLSDSAIPEPVTP